MKNIVSLLAVAALAIVIGAGCGGYENCGKADGKDKATCEKPANFKDNQSCKWVPAASKKDADGKCIASGTTTTSGTTGATTTATSDADLCKAKAAGPGADCKAVTLADTSKECKWDDTKTGDAKCQVGNK